MNTTQRLELMRDACSAALQGKPWQHSANGMDWMDAPPSRPIPNEFNYARPKPWILPAAPAGKQWHRTDFTEDMLPYGYRPLLTGETREADDEVKPGRNFGDGDWMKVKNTYTSDKEVFEGSMWTRTKRPLPKQPVTRPWKQASDIPSGVVYVRTTSHFRLPLIVTSVNEEGDALSLSDGSNVCWKYLSQWSSDRINWQPCTVTE